MATPGQANLATFSYSDPRRPYSDTHLYYHLSDSDEFEHEFDPSELNESDYEAAESDLGTEVIAAETQLAQFYRHRASIREQDFRPGDVENEEERLSTRLENINEELADIGYRQEVELQRRFDVTKRMAQEKRRVKPDPAQNKLANVSIAAVSPRPCNLGQAWSRKDHETVAGLASNLIEIFSGAPSRYDTEGVRQLCAALRHRFKAYEAMHLYNLAVVDANRLLDLLAKFGDVDVEVDEDLLPVPAASSLGQADAATATSSLETQRVLKRSASSDLGTKLVKRKKNGKGRSLQKTIQVTQLPVEIVLMIAENLDAADRIRLANTCYEWRSIPQLWQSFEFNRVNRANRQGWHRDTIDACIAAIETCQRRSHGTLSRVVLKGYLTPQTVGPVLDALRSSSATLRYIAIPTMDQRQCYEQLYQRCPNLEGVDIRFSTDKNQCCGHHTEHLSRATSPFPSKKLPFKLKSFISSQDFDCGDIAPHLEGIETVLGMRHMRQKQLNFIDAIVRAAPTLVEWRDDPDNRWDSTSVTLGDYGVGQEQLPKESIVFPKLRKLSGLWSEHFIDCDFPVLEEARLNSLRGPSSLVPVTQDEKLRIATVITKSPSLKKLDILLPSGLQALKQIFLAVSQLQSLEELGLWSSSTLSLQALVEVQEKGEDETAPGTVICPRLHTLRLHSRVVSVRFERELERELSQFLLTRFYLLKGCTFKETKARTHATLIAYEKKGFGMTKAQKKKTINASAAKAAASSAYKPTFDSSDDKRETFTSVLPKLWLSRGMTKHVFEGSQSLLHQLVFESSETDTSKDFDVFSGIRY